MSKAQRSARFPAQAHCVPARAGTIALAALLLALVRSESAQGAPVSCTNGPAAAARSNAQSLDVLAWAPFGRAEAGWSIYEPLVAEEIATACDPKSPGFAAALANWQEHHGLAGTGVLDPATFTRMRILWQEQRPFVAVSHLACPPAPEPAALSLALPDESYGGKQIRLRTGALTAYRKMVAAARAQVPALAKNRMLLTIFSAYRSPAYDAARCIREHNCQGVVRAACSAHRTGYAMDLYLGEAPGFGPDSAADANRLYLSRSDAYRWLVKNAAHFGFVNYAFEPWHWEWTGK